MMELLLEITLKGTVLLTILFGATAALRNASASMRHLVWTAGLAALLALPLLSAASPWRIEVLPVPGGETAVGEADRTAAVPTMEPARIGEHGAIPADGGTAAAEIAAAATPAGGELPAASVAAPESRAEGLPFQPATFLRWLTIAWLAGAALIVARLGLSLLSAWRLSRGAEPLTGARWYTALGSVIERMALRTPVRLLKTERMAMPMTCGVLRPSILLPSSAEEWSEERRRAVLLHELAHVRRMDLVTHHLAWLACAVYWFHPLVWAAARRLRHESERACDDLVLGTGTPASEYAGHLLDIVRAAGRARSPAMVVPMAQRSKFEGRLLAILEPGVERRGVASGRAVATVAAIAVLVVPLAAMAPVSGTRVEPDGGLTSRLVAVETGVVEEAGEAGWKAADRRSPESGTEVESESGVEFESGTEVETESGTEIEIESGIQDAQQQRDVARQTRQHEEAKDGRGTVALLAALGDDEAGVRKTAARALGEQDDPRAIEALIRALREDPDAGVRATAAWALGEIESPRAIPALGAALRTDESVEVQRIAAMALGEIESPEAIEALAEGLRAEDREVRAASAMALGEIESPDTVEALGVALRDESAGVRKRAAWALGEIESPASIGALTAALEDPDAEVRRTAVWALGEIEDPSALSALAAALRDSDAETRAKAAWAIGQLDLDTAPPALLEATRDENPEVRKMAAWALGEIEDPGAVPALRRLLKDPNAEVRKTATWALTEMEDEAPYEVLLELLEDENPEVRKAAARALGERN